MSIKETIYLHRKHRVCIGNSGAQKMWNRYSFWTHASDVEFDDGSTLDSKISNIKGISKDINAGDGYAADVSLVRSIRDSLKSLIDNLSNVVNGINNRLGGLRFYEDSNGKWVVGADSVPKKLGSSIGTAYKEAKYLYMSGSHETTWYVEGEHDGEAYLYGNCSQFNLNYAYPDDYANLKIGEDFMPVISIISAGQSYPSYGMYLPRCNVANCSATDIRLSDTKGERYSYYKSFLPESEDMEVINSSNGAVTTNNPSRGNFALYFPDGRLLVFTQQSHTVTGITVMR